MSEKYDFTKDASYRKMREEREARKRPDPVQVHITRIKDPPPPLGIREFNAVMANDAINVLPELFGTVQEEKWEHAAAALRQEKLHMNIFATYSQIYELFK